MQLRKISGLFQYPTKKIDDKDRQIYRHPRGPYKQGTLAVVQAGACTNVILVKGNPLENIDLVADQQKNFGVIMKGGKIYNDGLR
jgi:hypothetical protein